MQDDQTQKTKIDEIEEELKQEESEREGVDEEDQTAEPFDIDKAVEEVTGNEAKLDEEVTEAVTGEINKDENAGIPPVK